MARAVRLRRRRERTTTGRSTGHTIGGPKGALRNTRGVASDAKERPVMGAEKELNGVLTFEVPEIFAASSARPGRR